MSWLDKLLPPKIQQTDPSQRKGIPEGLWIKCPACESVLYRTDVEANLHVCPKCDHHMRIGARARLDALLDAEGRYEMGQEIVPVDALKFKDTKKYPDRIKAAMDDTGETDAMVVMGGAIHALPVVVACFEFEFMGGSMGSVVGERFARGAQTALEQKVPFICVTATGGARMQESLLSLMQMAKTTAMVNKLAEAPAAVHQRADRSDHGRCIRQLRLHGRRGDRRAACADRLCRPARDRADRARKAAGRLPAC